MMLLTLTRRKSSASDVYFAGRWHGFIYRVSELNHGYRKIRDKVRIGARRRLRGRKDSRSQDVNSAQLIIGIGLGASRKDRKYPVTWATSERETGGVGSRYIPDILKVFRDPLELDKFVGPSSRGFTDPNASEESASRGHSDIESPISCRYEYW